MSIEEKISRLKKEFELKKWYFEFMCEKFCEKCKISNKIVFCWYNKKENKTINVNKMIKCLYAKETILKHIDKCVLLCMNCRKIVQYVPDYRSYEERRLETIAQHKSDRKKENRKEFKSRKRIKPKEEKVKDIGWAVKLLEKSVV